MLQQQLDIFHGVKSITSEHQAPHQPPIFVLHAHKDSPLTSHLPQQEPQLVNYVFHAQHSPLLVHLPEHGLDICSIQPPAYGLLVQEMHSHVCIHHQVKSQHHVPQDIIYNNN